MNVFFRDARARNTHVEATLNLSCPAQVLGGVGSDAWVAFATAFAAGLHALALELHRLQTLLVLFFGDSNVGLEAATALGERFRGLGQDPRQTMAAATDMIRRSHDSDRAKQYDWYQWKTNGIVP